MQVITSMVLAAVASKSRHTTHKWDSNWKWVVLLFRLYKSGR